MPTQDVTYQQRLKIRRTTLGFGVIQVILGLALTALSFTAFVLSESEKIRNACPYWAGFTVFCSGGVGIVAWRHSSILSMGLFTFFSAVCVVLHMIGTILTGEVGGLLKSIVLCHQNTITGSCMCCDSIMTCKQNVPSFKFEGVEDCSILTGLLKELLYGLCVLNIFGSLVCFIATILGCTSVARQAGRDQPLFRRRLSAPSDSHEQSQYSWLHYPTDLSMLPPYAPPIYRSVDNFQDCGATPYIVPPPVFDPTDLPPPYTSRNASLSSSGFSLYEQSQEHRRGQLERDSSRGREGSASIVIQEVTTCNSANQFQQRIYSENRGRPGNPARITSAILTRNGVLEFCSNGNSNDANRTADQSLNSSQASLQSEARRPLDIIGQRIEGIAQCIETRVFQRYEKAEECKELDESKKLDEIQGQNITNSQHGKWKYSYKQSTNRTQRCLTSVDHSAEIIRFEDGQHDCSKVINNNDNIIPNGKIGRDIAGEWEVSSSMQIEEESSSNSDSGLGEDLSPLSQSINSNNDYNASVNITCNDAGNGEIVDTETCHNQGDHMSHIDDMSSLNGFAGNANTKDLTGDKDQGISEASCKEYGTSTNLLDSSADNVFAVRWNLFGTSCGFETSTSISGNDGKSFQPNPVLAKRCQTASSAGQECEEKGSPQYDEQQRSDNQRQLLSKTMPGYSIHDDATCNMMMPMEINPNSWTSNEEHLQLMPSNATCCQLSSDSGHQLLPSDSSHCELMMINTSQHQLMPSDASHCQLSSDVGHKLTPSDSSYCKLMSVDTRQHQLMPSDATHCQLSSDTSHELTPSDSSYCKLMSVDTRQHQLMPSDATHCQLSSDTSHELTPSDSSYCKLMSVDTRQHQLMPSDASHCQLSSDTSQHQLMPSDASHKEPNARVPDNPVGDGKLCEKGFPNDGSWHMLTPNDASHHQTYLNAKQQDKLKASDENQQLILDMDCDVLDSQRSADCCNDGYSDPVLELKSFRQKCSDNMEFMMEESGEGLFKKKEIITDKETLTGNQNIMILAGLGKTKKSDSKRKMEDIGIHASDSKPADDANQVIQLMDDFHSSNIKHIQSEWPPVVNMDANIEGMQTLRLCLSQQTASRMHYTSSSKDPNHLKSNMSSGRSSGEFNCDLLPDEVNPGYTLAANLETETLFDGGSEHEETPSIKIKPLTWSDTCIAQETNYLLPKEKMRTCSDPEVKGLRATGTEFTYHRKNIWNRGRLLYDDSFGVVPPNIELPLEMRNQGLVYCCPEDSKIQNRNTGNAEQGRKQRSTGSMNNLVKHQPKNPSCHHGNREASVKSKDDLLKKEQALMKTIKLRNEMSRSLMHLYREKRLNPRNKDSESLLRPGLEIPPNALKKRQLVQKGHTRNCELAASVEYPKKTGHHKHSAKDITGAGPDSPGKETFV